MPTVGEVPTGVVALFARTATREPTLLHATASATANTTEPASDTNSPSAVFLPPAVAPVGEPKHEDGGGGGQHQRGALDRRRHVASVPYD